MAPSDYDPDVIDTTADLDPVEEFFDKLETLIRGNPQKFVMPTMGSVTVRETDGKYRKRPAVAGSTFTITGIYAGKRSPVFTFKGDIPYDHEAVEFNQADASMKLQGFTDYLTGLLGEDFSTAYNRVKREGKKVEKASKVAEVTEKAQENPIWGSW